MGMWVNYDPIWFLLLYDALCQNLPTQDGDMAGGLDLPNVTQAT